MVRSFSGSSASASASATERHRKEGTEFSSTFFSRDGTPALRKYFCASTSEATCDQNSGTSTLSSLEHNRAVGILDLGRGQAELDALRRVTGRPWCSAVQFAFVSSPKLLGGFAADV